MCMEFASTILHGGKCSNSVCAVIIHISRQMFRDNYVIILLHLYNYTGDAAMFSASSSMWWVVIVTLHIWADL